MTSCPGASNEQELLPPEGARGESGSTVIDINGNKDHGGVGQHGLKANNTMETARVWRGWREGCRSYQDCAKFWCHLLTLPDEEEMSGERQRFPASRSSKG